ncbi:PepSY domain-containing protein [Neogemmobacter tilapiae]|uniref:PepSY domain-containing protein n=1 Tax=Neogemmobacter tilapiae TaxID=875041 RepID=A0A918WHH1_9RHOB|nr:PepSY domain-containing protein [Gemmobacter tilapiae]GHC46707.1 hypothetical protein GCM10007315_05590 [Gemmobacter tilapiae]
MKTMIRAVAVLGLSMMSVGAALADGDEADAATVAKATEVVTAEGYEVRKVEMEDGLIEVYAVKDGKMWELKLDAEYKVTEMEEADE